VSDMSLRSDAALPLQTRRACSGATGAALCPREWLGEWEWGQGMILRCADEGSGELAPLQGEGVRESMVEAVQVAWRLLGWD
jgi:hypothetical protein